MNVVREFTTSASTVERTRPLPVHRRVEHVMGMPISLALRGRHAHDVRAEEAWQAALRVLEEVDRVFSTYRADSVISRLDRGEIEPEDCPAEVLEVLELGDRACEESDGAFDVWRPGTEGGLVLDPSGVVKGWAVARAARELEVLPETDFCLSAGGDMVCRTKLTSTPDWQIGIEHPHDPTRSWPWCPSATGRSPRRASPAGVPTSSTRGREPLPRRSPRSPWSVLT